MKNIKPTILLVSWVLLTQKAFAQNDSLRRFKRPFRNEFGLDATGFIRFFTNFQNSDYNYTPTYYLTYRRYFAPGNLRFGIGGGASDQEQPSPYGDSAIYGYNSGNLDVRAGWEFTSDLSKRWQVFYGLDLRYSISHTKNEATSFNGGYALGTESSSTVFGLAPVLGFRFRINDRISVLTEASFSLNFARYKDRDFYTPVSGSGNPEIADKTAPDTKSIYTQFAQPIAVYFVFKI